MKVNPNFFRIDPWFLTPGDCVRSDEDKEFPYAGGGRFHRPRILHRTTFRRNCRNQLLISIYRHLSKQLPAARPCGKLFFA